MGHRHPAADLEASRQARGCDRATEGQDDDEEVAAEELVLAAVEYGDLAGALEQLSPEFRAVIQATVLDGLTTREASRLLGDPGGDREDPCDARQGAASRNLAGGTR